MQCHKHEHTWEAWQTPLHLSACLPGLCYSITIHELPLPFVDHHFEDAQVHHAMLPRWRWSSISCLSLQSLSIAITCPPLSNRGWRQGSASPTGQGAWSGAAHDQKCRAPESQPPPQWTETRGGRRSLGSWCWNERELYIYYMLPKYSVSKGEAREAFIK